MSEETSLDEFVGVNGAKSEEIEKPELIKGVAWSTIESVPDEWTVNNIESDIDILPGNNFSSDHFVEEGGIPLIRIRDLAEDETTVNFNGEYDSNYLINQEDLLVGMDGEFEPHLWTGPQALLNQRVCKIEPGSRHNKIFFRYAIEKPLFYIQKSIAGTTVKHLSQSNINDLNLPTPPLSEQRKIATILYTVDRAIEKTEETVEQMDIVQQGLLRSLFGKEKQRRNLDIEMKTERLGPKQFQVPATWEKTEISSIGEVVTGDTPSTDDESNFGGTLPFVTPETLSQGKYVTESSRTLSGAGRHEAKPIPEGSVMMDCIGSDMGKVAVSGCEVATNQQINSVVIDDASYLPEFLYYHLQVLSDFIKSQAGQTATPIVNKSSFESFAIFNPPIEEQQEIVDTLSIYDEGRRSNIEYLAGLERLKRGLMQDLLSGTIRTTNTNIEVSEEITQHG